jgi:hypothetical protein
VEEHRQLRYEREEALPMEEQRGVTGEDPNRGLWRSTAGGGERERDIGLIERVS